MPLEHNSVAGEGKSSDGPDGLEQPGLRLNLPYAYSRDHGILLRAMDGERAAIAMRAGADPTALLEVRR
ncbi:MAG: hypothetical protein V7650_16815, partial [Parasphingorhabdus sp.]